MNIAQASIIGGTARLAIRYWPVTIALVAAGAVAQVAGFGTDLAPDPAPITTGTLQACPPGTLIQKPEPYTGVAKPPLPYTPSGACIVLP